jgi:hypothetical protein
MSDEQKRIIREQFEANARMVRLNAERGVVYAHGQGPANERVAKAYAYLKSIDQHSEDERKSAGTRKR